MGDGGLPRSTLLSSSSELISHEVVRPPRLSLPASWPQRHQDVFITPRTQFPAQKQRVLNLLAQGHTEVYLHALGAAIPRAIHLALSVQSQIGPTLIQVRTHTDTVELTDEFEPIRGDASSTVTKTRPNSALHVRLSYLPPTSPPKVSVPPPAPCSSN